MSVSEEPSTGDILDVTRVLPHRYPFLLLDRILRVDAGKAAVGLKAVTMNEPFFQGHFPGRPVMPAVLITEAMAQVGGVLLLSMSGNEGKLAYFAGIDGQKFRKPVLPGDLLVMRAEIVGTKGHIGKVRAEAYVLRLETSAWGAAGSAETPLAANQVSMVEEPVGAAGRTRKLLRGIMDGELAAEGELMFALMNRDDAPRPGR